VSSLPIDGLQNTRSPGKVPRYAAYGGQEPLEWNCTVEVGRTTRFDLDLSER